MTLLLSKHFTMSQIIKVHLLPFTYWSMVFFIYKVWVEIEYIILMFNWYWFFIHRPSNFNQTFWAPGTIYILILLFWIPYTSKQGTDCRELDFHWNTTQNSCQNVILHCLSFANEILPLMLFCKICNWQNELWYFRFWVTKSMAILCVWWINIDLQKPKNINYLIF